MSSSSYESVRRDPGLHTQKLDVIRPANSVFISLHRWLLESEQVNALHAQVGRESTYSVLSCVFRARFVVAAGCPVVDLF